ncbi:hypothetical protein TWF481_001936 [Arthrobotrys musiformis]|uniref:Uncharacterized protein n=1 Tax=Arthrobotrys musiformis TaxID=47236 RepID=A0AAV9VX55_9PEZI
MVKYKLLSTALLIAATGTQAVIGSDTPRFERRQFETDENMSMPDDQPMGHQVYEWYNQTDLAGFMPKSGGSSNMTQVEMSDLGAYKPGPFQDALQSCLDEFEDESQYCITRFGHKVDISPNATLPTETARKLQGSTAILCCKGGYTMYLFNYRTWGEENHDVRINCWNAALIANETLSSLLNPSTMKPEFMSPVQPQRDNGGNATTTMMARSYWSEDKTWGLDVYYRSDKQCTAESRYTWVEKGKWADLEPSKDPEEDPVPTDDMDDMDPEPTSTDDMDDMVPEITNTPGGGSNRDMNGTMTTMAIPSADDDDMVSIQTANPEAPGSMQSTMVTRTTPAASSSPSPTERPLEDFPF